MRLRPALVALACLLSVACRPAPSGAGPAEGLRPGLVVEAVARGSTGEKAGVQVGDLLLRWRFAGPPPSRTGAAAGYLESVADLAWVEAEKAARAEVRLAGRRRGKLLELVLPAGFWGIEARPNLVGETLAGYLGGRELLQAGRAGEAAAAWGGLAGRLSGPRWLSLRLFLRSKEAEAWVTAKRWSEAHEAFREALAIARRPGLEAWIPLLLYREARAFRAQGDLAEADLRYRLGIAFAGGREDLLLTSALGCQHRAELAAHRGALDLAERSVRESLVLRRRLAPGSTWTGRSLGSLGIVALERGDLDRAEELLRRAVSIESRVDAGSISQGTYFSNLALIEQLRGELVAAEDLLERYLAILRKTEGQEVRLAATLNNLASVRFSLGSEEGAEALLREALRIKQREDPRSMATAIGLGNLGGLLSEEGKLEEAGRLLARALEIKRRLAPGSASLGEALAGLGELERRRGQLEAAESDGVKALAVVRKATPGTLLEAQILELLAEVRQERGDLAGAERTARRALAVRERIAPGTREEAGSCRILGSILRAAGRPREALRTYRRGVEALESQRGRLRSPSFLEPRLSEGFADLHRELVDLLVAERRPGEALGVLERSRGRLLLALLAERDLLAELDLPPSLERRLRAAEREVGAAEAKLAGLSTVGDRVEVSRLGLRLSELRERAARLWAEAKAASPRLARARVARRVDPRALADGLEPGTVLLELNVATSATDLFVLEPGRPLRALRLAVGKAELARQVGELRRLVDGGRDEVGAGIRRRARLSELEHRLYGELLGPVEATVAAARRLAIAADGPLRRLPFALLARPGGEDGGEAEYLIEWKPIHYVLSATLAETLRAARAAGDGPVVAFGDPRTAAPGTPNSALGRVARALFPRGFDLPRLPGSRGEVEGIAALFPRSVLKLVGHAASEERARHLPADARYVHFACHGLLDERSPLDSSLVLSMLERGGGEGADGFLQVWEILEDVHTDADLVVLSACRSALGRDMGGEGLLGLTEGFLSAGARSVIASQWAVTDETTGGFMYELYRRLKAGEAKDEALQGAQVAVLRGELARRGLLAEDRRAPYYWAGFELVGAAR